MTALRLSGLCACLAVAALANTAAAEDKRERARALHDKGLEHYAEGDYALAIDNYRRAYELVPAAGILFNLAQAHRKRGDCAEALELYQQYVAEEPAGPNSGVAVEHMTTMRECLASSEPDPRPPPTVEDKPQARPAPPGEVAQAGRGVGSDVVPESPPTGDPGATKRLVGAGVGIAGVGALGLAIYFGLEARAASSDLDDFFAGGGTWGDEQQALEDKGKRNDALMLGFTAVGVAAVAAGTALYLLGNRESGERSSDLAVVPADGGALVVWGGSY